VAGGGEAAARSGNLLFFRSPENRQFLVWLKGPLWGSPPIPLTRVGQSTLREIARSWPDQISIETKLDYASLGAGFRKLAESDALDGP